MPLATTSYRMKQHHQKLISPVLVIIYVYQFRNRQEIRDNDSKSNSSTTLQRENLLQRKHKQATKKCAKHFSSVIESHNLSNLNAMINSTELNLEESLDVELNEDNESDNEQDKAESNAEYNEEEHFFKKRSKFSANWSHFIDS